MKFNQIIYVKNFQTEFIMLYAFFWVIPRGLNFIYQPFGTICLFHLHRRL